MLSWTAQNVVVFFLREVVWRVGTFNFRNDLVAGWICKERSVSASARARKSIKINLLRIPSDGVRSPRRVAAACRTNDPRYRATYHPS